MVKKVNKKKPTNADQLREFTAQFSDVTALIRPDLAKIQELDKECEVRQRFVENLTGPILQTFQSTRKDVRAKRFKALKSALAKLEQLSTEKVKLAMKNYETLDNYVDELDTKYASIVAETSAQSTSSQKSTKQKNSTKKVEEVKQEKFDPTTVVDMPVDPNEPTYCLCNRVSFGQMVMCDNKTCLTEWFHFDCVGLTAPPKGKWYCPICKER
ncbi:unnamed protein product [Bursaphelenchus okinawaensis]|uniref:Inhibitor of growth protein n=1 Tax=Bursaphelenchus okinawaensis TaxID=465554 RepID=A0A811JQG9_9BILA|nr:unnamed protein product [Bursaphelenchus okinawaensis]CAG9077796.1 unnamed protein product [Bursaphelenchus okinawaensis]